MVAQHLKLIFYKNKQDITILGSTNKLYRENKLCNKTMLMSVIDGSHQIFEQNSQNIRGQRL